MSAFLPPLIALLVVAAVVALLAFVDRAEKRRKPCAEDCLSPCCHFGCEFDRRFGL